MTDYIVHGKYIATIGIECHVQLATNTKLFSSVDNDAREAEPNSKVSAIDYALPGMLPILNREAIVFAARAGKALNAEVAKISRFDRKHYFYPDLPKGYQTTQMYQPIILSGHVDLPNGESVRIHHAHLEEDAGKLTHYSDYSLVDLNRAGTPLIEIVSEPDIHSAASAKLYAQELQMLMTYAGVSYGNLFHGNMRFDVNVSVAKKGVTELGTRAEVKNLNSFKSVERAADYEIARQIDILERDEKVVQETRGWLDDAQKTVSQRGKEDAQDYRYMPDADIPPVVLTDEDIADMQSGMPLMPGEFREKFAKLNVDESVVGALLMRRENAETVAKILDKSTVEVARRVANLFASSFVIDEESDVENVTLPTVGNLITLAEMMVADELSSTAGKEIFVELLNCDQDPRMCAEAKNLLQNSDVDEIAKIVDEVLADPASQKPLQDIRAGNDKAIGFLVGQIMKKSGGKANPAMAQKLIRERI